MPVILTTPQEWETWLAAPTDKALKLYRSLENGLLKIVLIGKQEDAGVIAR
jgi:putative SOS response-associated peptidase YedK